MTTIFTHGNATDKDGMVGIGKLPNDWMPILETIFKEYCYIIPNKNSTVYHTYCTELQDNLKENVDKIQYAPFWDNIGTSNQIMRPVVEMNEIYYSNPKPNFEQTQLYGAAANLIPHRDCILFRFTGIHFYRVIIGLSDNNNDTITEFIHHRLEHKINCGDYMIFDFDKTLHRVKKTGKQETPRVLMKLHFIVCDAEYFTENYVTVVTWFYKTYYHIARYTEQIGTEPTTFVGFFWGVLWEWPFYASFKYAVGMAFAANTIALNFIYPSIVEREENRVCGVGKLAAWSLSNMFVLYLGIVTYLYFRFVFFGIQ
jgi:hypothetical protein